MKISYIIKSIANFGGTERVIVDKMNYLAGIGFDVSVITYEQGSHDIVFELDPRIKHYDINTRFFTLGNNHLFSKIKRYHSMKMLFKERLDNIMKEINPDIIITTTYSLKILKQINETAKSLNTKVILESHCIFKSILRHYDFDKNSLKYYIWFVFDLLSLSNVKNVDLIVTLTTDDAKKWNKYNKTIVIPNAIKMSLLRNDNSTKYRIISAGRLEHEKGFDMLIRAIKVAKLPDKWHVDIFGSGTEKDNLIKLINELDLNKIISINEPTNNIYEEYSKSDFFVLSSRKEGFGLVLAESMSVGTSCIAFNCDYGPKDIIRNNINGLLAEPNDINDLSIKINWMIRHQKERIIMANNGLNKVKEFNIDSIMEKWILLYNNIKNMNYD